MAGDNTCSRSNMNMSLFLLVVANFDRLTKMHNGIGIRKIFMQNFLKFTLRTEDTIDV